MSGQVETADVFVVGAGPGGSASAAYLTGPGLDVLLLEDGRQAPVLDGPSHICDVTALARPTPGEREAVLQSYPAVMDNLPQERGGGLDDRESNALSRMAPTA